MRYVKQTHKSFFVLVAVAIATATAAAGALGGAKAVAPGKLTIAYQPGLGYAPLILMKHEKTIEKRFPGTQVDWKVLASGTTITDGVIAGDIQVGAVGVGPMLVGWARGVKWKVIAPLNEGDLWLMAKDREIRTIADLPGKRIATPARTSIQAVTLRKMAEVKLGNARALDSGLVDMDHPEGVQALSTGQIDAHLTSPPFQFQERARGAHIVARSYNYFGAHTFLVTVMTQKFYDEYPQFAKAFYESVVAIERLIEKNPDRVAKVLQQDAGGNPTNRQFKQWLVSPVLNWTTRPRGLMRTANFMFRTQQIGRRPPNWRELVFPPVYATKGS
jgi:ABC-type nitrate/sulfonate/bicarbonate transport system substrate-binding protein